jgi:alpha-tubulin suppressor-like RCC1 family protein
MPNRARSLLRCTTMLGAWTTLASCLAEPAQPGRDANSPSPAAPLAAADSPTPPQDEPRREQTVRPAPHFDWDPSSDCSIERVAVGGRHACAITSLGHVVCWGHNESLQLGVPSVADSCALGASDYPCSDAPVPVPGLEAVVELALSNTTSCALDRDGRVWCWGVSQSDVLRGSAACDLPALATPAQRHLSCSPAPRIIAGIDHALSVGAWGTHCAVERHGTLKCWTAHMGRTPTPVADVAHAVQTDYSCVLSEQGKIQCWYCNDYGQRGDGSLAPAQEVGVPSNCELSTSTVAWAGFAVQVSSGYQHACLVDESGTLACWGSNDAGQLGVPSSGPRRCNYGAACATEPVRVPDVEDAVQAAAGLGFTCVLDRRGQVMCMGGHGRSDVALPAPALQLAARYGQACAVVQGGRVFCWHPAGPLSTTAGTSAAPREISLCPR